MEALGIAVVIPTFNNDGTLVRVLQEVAQYCRHIYVVDDGSTDQTPALLAGLQGFHVLTHARNRGKGRALRTGLLAARGDGFRYALTIDSDGQHFPSDIPLFVEEAERCPGTFVVGARNLASENMPSRNTFANKFSNFWFWLETGIRLEDTQSGFRLYPLSALGSLRCYTARFEFEVQILVFAAWKGYPVKSLPVRVYYPPGKERVSHFRPVRDFARISVLNTILVMLTLLWFLPLRLVRNLTMARMRTFFREQILHSAVPNHKVALSVMLGVFMGIVPLWGYQMITAVALAQLLRLNKVITLVASNISIPPMIPLILYASYASGCWLLSRPVVLDYRDLSLDNVWQVMQQYLLGSLAFGALAAVVAAGVVYFLLLIFRRHPDTAGNRS